MPQVIALGDGSVRTPGTERLKDIGSFNAKGIMKYDHRKNESNTVWVTHDNQSIGENVVKKCPRKINILEKRILFHFNF